MSWTQEEYEEYLRKTKKQELAKAAPRLRQNFKNDKPKQSKFHNQKTEIDGMKFDSKKEAEQYLILKARKQAGEIKDFKRQVRFILQGPFKLNGKNYRKIEYIADFVVTDLEDNMKVIDVKASKKFQDPVYRLKKKFFMRRYQVEITEVY